jgi:hypothetical protein
MNRTGIRLYFCEGFKGAMVFMVKFLTGLTGFPILSI